MHPRDEFRLAITRRQFFGRTATGIGGAALASLLNKGMATAAPTEPLAGIPGVLGKPHLPPRAMRVIYLFMQGGPSQLDLFDPKPELHKRHGEDLPTNLQLQSHDVDQPCAALVTDLKRRGLLDDTLVVWGGEFGRTTYCQGRLTQRNFGRDHHGRCFTMWLAGGGIRPGITHGQTDDYCYNVVRDGVHVHDLNATILHCLGVDHTRLTFKFQGRYYRLTDVEGKVVDKILA